MYIFNNDDERGKKCERNVFLEFFAAASGNAADVVLGMSVFINKGWTF